MPKHITPVILVMVSIALFFFFIVPRYEGIKDIQERIVPLNEALSNSKKIQAVRDGLLSSYNNIAEADLDRLQKILPDHVDNVRLILEVDRIASRNNMILQNVVTRGSFRDEQNTLGPNDSLFGKLRINFSIAGRYDSLVNFLSELEQSLRVVDVVALSFSRGEGDFYEYEIEVDTYWLR